MCTSSSGLRVVPVCARLSVSQCLPVSPSGVEVKVSSCESAWVLSTKSEWRKVAKEERE